MITSPATQRDPGAIPGDRVGLQLRGWEAVCLYVHVVTMYGAMDIRPGGRERCQTETAICGIRSDIEYGSDA